MEELMKVQVKNDRQLVSARDLHKGLGLKGRFSRWFKTNSELFTENEDFYKCTSSTVVNNGAVRELDDYLLTIEMAKQLAMMARTEKSKLYREYFLDLERKWNSPEMVMHRALEFSNARIKQLKLENKNLSIQLEESNKKADYLDVILGTPDALAISQIAADYGYGAVSFNRLLHKVGIQHRVNGQWILYRAYMGKNYVTTKPFIYKDHKGNNRTSLSTYWTQAGRKLIYDVLKDNDILPLIERDDIA
ncbi:phage antirepressor KilAC domain-containing protein [Lactobacillus crispatus]|uniref:phage antirepressor KilAC domain-containing protein n=1 Tax=Lactobacillus crispatus TaxID=47770 RepID=UPI000F852C88|nr:phage antirepressor KilAC domain-containing protein [Lactobacillus crispatus]AZR16003.1 phage antirepressor Ant [Lactobacillus crispatus]MCT7687483.1 phage antirepressor KilAC domain-containing protein [Lactobacillus crispatus]MCT7742444.1 phage antirepressor KilAC domain-containing protein [Lactobacillus crispatus]MCT7788715.1 phage antirepressor KilAC domain-containing protein [Lactobacillus crispatus]MCT7852820.1 phage antirepressor KilAC domain-containing protein [Lactobacillus crispatu